MRGPRPCANSIKGYEAAVIGDVIAITVFAFTDRLRRHTGIARWRGLSSLIPIDRNATRAREGFTMDMDRDISRRHMLALSAAAGGLAFGGGMSRAVAQSEKRIEQLAPELDKIIATNEPIKELATGFGGPLGPAEGPLVAVTWYVSSMADLISWQRTPSRP